MKLIPIPGSSMIASLGYDQEQEVLVVQFQNDTLYRYKGAPVETYVAIMNDKESHGRAFNEHIKNRNWPTEQIDAEAVLGI